MLGPKTRPKELLGIFMKGNLYGGWRDSATGYGAYLACS